MYILQSTNRFDISATNPLSLPELDQDVQTRWLDFSEGALKEYNTRSTFDLVSDRFPDLKSKPQLFLSKASFTQISF